MDIRLKRNCFILQCYCCVVQYTCPFNVCIKERDRIDSLAIEGKNNCWHGWYTPSGILVVAGGRPGFCHGASLCHRRSHFHQAIIHFTCSSAEIRMLELGMYQ